MSLDSMINESNLKYNAIEFDKVREEDFLPAIKQTISVAKENIAKIKGNPEEPSFQNTIESLETVDLELNRVLNIFYNLYSAEASESLQELAPQVSSLTSNYSSDLSLDLELFERVKSVYDNHDKANLNPEEKMLLEKAYKGFVRNGALLSDDKKAELRKLDEELASLGPKFSENVLKETNAFELLIENPKDIKGLPPIAVEAARELALEKGIKKKSAWIINLDAPSFIPFLKYAESRELRKKVWMAYQTRCTSGEYSNLEVISKIVELRHKRAKHLGYDTHAHYVLEERMAKTPQNVDSFLEKIKNASVKAATKDLEDVKAFATEKGFDSEFKPWDMAFYTEQLKKDKYDFDPEELRPYFPVDKCIKGAFDLAERLFSIRFNKIDDIPRYHDDVISYEVFDSKTNDFIGLFYADFFPRPTKRGGAWMTSYRSQGWNGKDLDRPHVSIVCNFTKATSDKPSLLNFGELETLFHEFGHSLHGLLSQCKYKSLAGTNVNWDFVELPSQFMENWLLEKEVLDLFAGHYKTGEKVPQDLIDKLQKSAKFQAGYASLRQINYANLDMKWHGVYHEKIEDVMAYEREVTKETSLFAPEESTMFSTGFSHIFAGGYSAGYYSYKWAEVLDADAYEYFKENNLFSEEVAQKFKTTILEKGGSVDPSELYREFRGKNPDPDALLKRDGLL